MAREYPNDGSIQCSMMSSLRCDEAIDPPRPIGTLGNGQYDIQTAKTFSDVAEELGLAVEIIPSGKKMHSGRLVARGCRGVYIGYYKPDQIDAFWNRVKELQQAQASS